MTQRLLKLASAGRQAIGAVTSPPPGGGRIPDLKMHITRFGLVGDPHTAGVSMRTRF